MESVNGKLEKEEVELLFFSSLQNKNVNKEMINFFLKIGTKKLTNSIDEEGNGSLHFLCSNKKMSEELIVDLLEKGANANLQNHLGQTPLHFAALNPVFTLSLFQKMQELKFRRDLADSNGNFALHYYCYGNPNLELPLLQSLLQLKKDDKEKKEKEEEEDKENQNAQNKKNPKKPTFQKLEKGHHLEYLKGEGGNYALHFGNFYLLNLPLLYITIFYEN